VRYLNSVPLAAKPGIGKINGIGDGVAAWSAATSPARCS
jgi:hypothetical protein